MSSRPVLAMTFYESSSGALVNPFLEMVEDAKKQKRHQEEDKKKIIDNTIQSIEQVVNHFLPEESLSEEKREQRKQKSGPSKYKKEYFEHLDNNLKLINTYLEVLQKQV